MACCSNDVDIEFKEKAFRAIHQMLELNATKTNTNSTNSISLLSDYLNICRNFEANVHANETNKSTKPHLARSNTINNRVAINVCDSKEPRSSEKQSRSYRPTTTTTKSNNSITRNRNSTMKPPRPPPPVTTSNLTNEPKKRSPDYLSKYSSSSSPVFTHEHVVPSNLNFFYRHNHQNGKDSVAPSRPHYMAKTPSPGLSPAQNQRPKENLNRCLGEDGRQSLLGLYGPVLLL